MPSIIHVNELTQPQGHSTSGSHERYKTKERLEWEAEFDCVRSFACGSSPRASPARKN